MLLVVPALIKSVDIGSGRKVRGVIANRNSTELGVSSHRLTVLKSIADLARRSTYLAAAHVPGTNLKIETGRVSQGKAHILKN